MKQKILFLALLITAIFFVTCKSTQRLSTINFNSVYNSELATINPDLYIFHNDIEESKLYFRINSDELQYIKGADEDAFKAKFSLQYRIIPSFNSTNLVDSASVYFIDSLNFESGNYISDSINIFAPKGENYILHLVIYDHNSKSANHFVKSINKKSDYSLQNFKFFNSESQLIYNPFIDDKGILIAQYKHPANFSMKAFTFTKDYRTASPPFLENKEASEITADSVFNINFKSGIGIIPMKSFGHYYFFNKNDTTDGFSTYNFHKGFPYITTHESMLAPIRYLVSNSEYDALKKQQDLRSAIDRFWVSIAGDAARAKQLVSRYYQNVQYSNIYFTSYKEGWKTDRGMIYTIFGPPEIVFFYEGKETWHYKDKWRMMEIQFDFVHQEHEFTNNHYILIRKPEHRNPWYLGVENWRK